jgi:hypothetical protein
LLGHCYAGEVVGPEVALIRSAVTGFAECVRPVDVTLIRWMMIRFSSVGAFSCDQQLFPHFSEAGAAIFTIEQVQYGGHDHPHRLTLDLQVFHREFSR